MNEFLDKFEKYSIENYGYIRLPEIKIDANLKKDLGLLPDVSNFDFITALTRNGFKKKANLIPKDRYKEYGDRIKNELSILEELGFVDYILLVWQIINKARELGVFIDYGRGSVAGSAVCWLIGISGVDPIKNNLFFERFISKTRAGKKYIDGKLYLKGDLLADIDINLGDGIDQIVAYLNEIYPNRVSKIMNISTFTTKILLKDIYKSLEEVSETEAKEISDMIEIHFGIAQSIEEVYKKNEDFKKWADQHSNVIKIAKTLSDLTRQTSTHASGRLVGFYELNDLIPLELSKDDELISGYDMREVSNFFCKLDLLGLATNQILKNIVDNIDENIEDISLENDPFIYSKFQDNKLLPYGLYQISADCAYKVLNLIKPKNILELSDISAIARPGALAYQYSYAKNDQKCPHPLFEKILRQTRNVCLYQEQMMQMSVAIGFTLDEAETLRKITAKKLIEKIKEWKDRVYQKCEEGGFGKEIGDIFWKILDDSSKYSFNFSHSLATAYLSALTVYLKYKYPTQFYWACLKAVKNLANPVEEISFIQQELSEFNIKLLPPSLTKVSNDFVVEGNDIRMGLGSIKGISEATLEKLRLFNHENTNKFSLISAFEFAKIPLSAITPLVLSGAMDEYCTSRSKLLLEIETYRCLTVNEKNLIQGLGAQYNYDLLKIIKEMVDNLKDAKGKPLIKQSRFETIKKKYDVYKKKYLLNIKNEELSNYLFEHEYLGFSYSINLKKIYQKYCPKLKTIAEIKAIDTQDRYEKIQCVGQVIEAEKNISKQKKAPYLSIQLRDHTGSIKVLLMGQDKIDNFTKFNAQELAEKQILIINGAKKGDVIFMEADSSIQECCTIIKKSEIKTDAAEEE